MEAHDSSIALIIPHTDDRKNLNHLLQSIKSWTKMANEIIIVDSSQDSESIQYDFVEFCSSKKIKLIHFRGRQIFYGSSVCQFRYAIRIQEMHKYILLRFMNARKDGIYASKKSA